MITIIERDGITPRTLKAAGIDMIPAPTMLVETLKMAPAKEPCFSSGGDDDDGDEGSWLGNRGALIAGVIFSQPPEMINGIFAAMRGMI